MAAESNLPVRRRVPAPTAGQPRAFFREGLYDAQVEFHGYDVFIDKAIKCPCKIVNHGGHLTECVNCGGIGWLFVQRYETKAILQSMNEETNNLPWSQAVQGMSKVTLQDREEIGFYDKITVRDVLMTYCEVKDVATQSSTDRDYVMLTYTPNLIHSVHAFNTEMTPLIELSPSDYEISGNYLIITRDNLPMNTTITVRYEFNPQYLVLDIVRAGMTAPDRTDQGIGKQKMPNYLVARLLHFEFEQGRTSLPPE